LSACKFSDPASDGKICQNVSCDYNNDAKAGSEMKFVCSSGLTALYCMKYSDLAKISAGCPDAFICQIVAVPPQPGVAAAPQPFSGSGTIAGQC
jgi:hypothetical protein